MVFFINLQPSPQVVSRMRKPYPISFRIIILDVNLDVNWKFEEKIAWGGAYELRNKLEMKICFNKQQEYTYQSNGFHNFIFQCLQIL